MKKNKILLIIDNQSKFLKILESFLKEQKINYKKFLHDQKIDLSEEDEVAGIILSGGKGGPSGPLYLSTDYSLIFKYRAPIIGFCLGHEIIAKAFSGEVGRIKRRTAMEEVIIDRDDPIFKGLPKKIFLKEKHYLYVSRLPKDFEILAHSADCPVEIMRHKNKPIYGFQSHPEVLGRHGEGIIKNFLKICGLIK